MSNSSSSHATDEFHGIPLGAPALELWLNGLYTCIVIATLYASPKSAGGSKIRTWMWSAIVISMYFFATVHSTMTKVFELRTLTLHGGDPSVIEAFGHQSRVFRITGATAFLTTMVIADCLLIWRCWIVWERCWSVCVVPILSTIAGTVLCIISIIGQVAVAETRTPGVIPEHFIKMTTPYFILSLVTSLYSTILITARVVMVQRQTNTYMLDIGKQCRPRFSRAIEVLVESVALNTINLIAFVVFTIQKSERLDWPQDVQPQIAGIATTLLLLRVALGHARSEAEWSAPTLRSVVFTSYSTTNVSGLGRGDVLHPQAPQMEEKKDSRRGTLASSWSDMSTLDDVC